MLDQRIDECGAPMITFGVFGAINFPIFYLVWWLYGEVEASNFIMRLIAFLLCIPLIFKNYLPQKILRYLSLYWYFTLFYTLPFFGSYMFLSHHGSIIWLTNGMVGLFWLILVTDWLSFTILLPLGVLAGVCYFLAEGNKIYFISPNMTGTMINYLWAIVIAAVFGHSRERLQKAKLYGMETLSASLAHELRTPLKAITFGTGNIKKYLENLVQTYEIAKGAKLDIPYIDPLHYQSLMPSFERIEAEGRSAFTFIDMLLVKVKQPSLKAYQLETCSISNCVEEALHRYPFGPDELEMIKWHRNRDFKFKGNQLLVIHVLFNLIKNSLRHIKDVKKGRIDICLSENDDFNILHFKDNGTGIARKFLPLIFDPFASETNHGTGIGLTYCKYAMKNLQGDIKGDSIPGEYTEFKLFFPKI